MKKTIFLRLMFYLGLFFLILCLLTYFALTSFFEAYYTKSRTDNLKESTMGITEAYNQSGLTLELEETIDDLDEEGIVVQIIKEEAPEVVSRVNYYQNVQTIEPIGLMMIENKESDEVRGIVIAFGEGGGKGQRKGYYQEESGYGEGSGQGYGGGQGYGQGEGSGNESGQGHGYGQQKSLETQVEEHEDGETFVTVLGNNDHIVEWITYKAMANDQSQVIGRIPSYSVHEVVHIVSNFLMVFLLIIFGSSLIFAYFFARGISKPIVNLNDIAGEMGKLNFAKKYEGKRKDEIGELGSTLNQISDELEGTIEKLQGELNKERTLEKMRQRFTAQVSHEIQTPLAIIKSYAEALEDDLLEDNEEAQEYYKTIALEADKISGIAVDLLDLAQIESGAYTLKKEKTLGYECLEEVVNRFKHLDSKKNIELTDEGTKTLVMEIDKKRLEQVFYNLLSNAVKHVKPFDGLIEIRSQLKENEWRISVYNEGENIPEKEIEQIWEYFYKATSDKKGTGLGLAIVKGIVKCHQGEVGVENSEKGVSFFISIPIK